jgi:nucleoside-diphosphate-sugar epimerase
MMVPTSEDAPKTRNEAEDGKGFRVLLSEQVVFEQHPDATHFRYPYIYGRYQIAPREWPIVKRILDKRPHIVLPDDGLTLNHHGGAQNMAHAVLLAVDSPQSRGQIYNCGDDRVLTLRQVIETCARALDHDWDVVSMPYELAIPARPMIAQPWTTHRVFDTGKIKRELGYSDVVDPLVGVADYARWLARNGVDERGERALQDPFDYAAEDRLIENWKVCVAAMPTDLFDRDPGYTASYSGPGGSTRKSEW